MELTPRTSLSLLVLKTDQLDRLRDFYDVIGIQFHQEQHGAGPIHYAGQLGELVIEIYPLAASQSVDATTRLGFRVGDLDAVNTMLAQRGLVEVKQPRQTEWGRRLVVKDPDGRSVELYDDADDGSDAAE